MIEFGSAVEALSAAIEIQQAMADANRHQPADTAIAFRIGLSPGRTRYFFRGSSAGLT
jgi:adenylate cyclase